MVYEFKVNAGVSNRAAEAMYFLSVERATKALVSLELENLVSTAEALQACEYLDCVDSCDLPMTYSLYQACVALVGAFLRNASLAVAKTLAGRSWAANTLLPLVRVLPDDGAGCVGPSHLPMAA